MRFLGVSFLALFVFWGGCTQESTTGGTTNDLVVAQVTTPPTMDGVGDDAAWGEAQDLVVTVGANAAYQNYFGQVDVTLTAVRTDTDFYLKVMWEDPSGTRSDQKKVWEYVNGAWNRTSNNEDRFYIFFDMEQNGSQGADCATMCHASPEGMWTSTGIVDEWQWKAARTAPIHYSDDAYIDSVYQESDGSFMEDFGHHHDSATTGFYHDNIMADSIDSHPLYMGPIDENGFIIIPAGSDESALTPFDPTFADTTQTIPGYYLDAKAAGSRADVTAYATYSNGIWTIEFKRALDTGNSDDVVFAPGKTVQAVIAITDDDEEKHSGSEPFNIKF